MKTNKTHKIHELKMDKNEKLNLPNYRQVYQKAWVTEQKIMP